MSDRLLQLALASDLPVEEKLILTVCSAYAHEDGVCDLESREAITSNPCIRRALGIQLDPLDKLALLFVASVAEDHRDGVPLFRDGDLAGLSRVCGVSVDEGCAIASRLRTAGHVVAVS